MATRWATHRILRTDKTLTIDLHTWADIFLLLRLTTATVHRHLLLCKDRATHQATLLSKATHTHLHLSALHPTTLLQLPRQQLQPHLRLKSTHARSHYHSRFQSPSFQNPKRTNARTRNKVRVNSSLPPSRRPKRKHSLAHNHRRQPRLQPLQPPLPPRALDRPSRASTRCLPLARTANHLSALAAGVQEAAVWRLISPCTSSVLRRAGTSKRSGTWTRPRSRLTRRGKHFHFIVL